MRRPIAALQELYAGPIQAGADWPPRSRQVRDAGRHRRRSAELAAARRALTPASARQAGIDLLVIQGTIISAEHVVPAAASR